MPRKKKNTTEIITTENQDISHSMNEQAVLAGNLIRLAIEKKVPVETLEKLLEMRTALKVEKAIESFNLAMADFQAECPIIKKTKEVKTKAGKVAYSYAPIETIIEQVKSLLVKHGFSYSIKQIHKESTVKVICIVNHIEGHSENTEMEVPLGNKTDIMSNTQVVAAASTFAKRYTFCNAFGILTGDEDNDARPQQITEIHETINNGRRSAELKSKPVNDISYYANGINKNILSWKDIKECMIKANIIKDSPISPAAMKDILYKLNTSQDKLLKNEIENLLNKVDK